jgi:hypothetical protein
MIYQHHEIVVDFLVYMKVIDGVYVLKDGKKLSLPKLLHLLFFEQHIVSHYNMSSLMTFENMHMEIIIGVEFNIKHKLSFLERKAIYLDV